jgi:SAM-dependent methyltransferase
MTTAVANLTAGALVPSGSELWLRCSECLACMGPVSDRDDGVAVATIECEECGSLTHKINGVWRTLSHRQLAPFAQFKHDYEEIRRSEGRGSNHPAFYLALPFADLTANFADQWRIRARSYRYLERQILPYLEERHGNGFRVLDIGAGNGWLSYRLTLSGLRPVAVDLCSNAYDGLEAARHYSSLLPEFFPRFEAEMNHLPFDGAQFDVAIYNASFHYSTNYDRTLREALRCLRPGGTVLIIDSPTYQLERSGEAMRSERHDFFEKKFGTRADALPTGEFLTPEIMCRLSMLGIRWTRHLAWYGLRWWLRPVIAGIKKRREPSQFYLYEGQVETT